MNSGFNYLELIIDKNAFNDSKADHDVLIKIKSIKDDMVYYLNDDKSLSYEPIFLNTVDLEDINQIKDQIMPNSKYEVKLLLEMKMRLDQKTTTKSIKTTEIIVPDKFTIKFDQNKFRYIVNQESKDSDVVTYLSVLDASNNEEIYSSNKIKLNSEENLNFDFNLYQNQKYLL